MSIIGKVIAVNISDRKGVVKTPVDEVTLREGHGIEGDAHAGDWHRQVSLLGIESFEKMRAKGMELELGKFAENITTQGIVLYELPVGARLQIGDTLHEVTQIGKQCHSGCEIKKLVGDCVMPREGIFTKVVKGGKIRPDDSIEVL